MVEDGSRRSDKCSIGKFEFFRGTGGAASLGAVSHLAAYSALYVSSTCPSIYIDISCSEGDDTCINMRYRQHKRNHKSPGSTHAPSGARPDESTFAFPPTPVRGTASRQGGMLTRGGRRPLFRRLVSKPRRLVGGEGSV